MKKNILFSIIVVIVFLVGLDKAVKYYDRYQAKRSGSGKSALTNKFLTGGQVSDYLKATELRLTPYMMFAVKPDFKSATININSLGLRGKEVSPKREDVKRVVIVGGSGAMGYGATADDRTFSSVLERLLNEGAAQRYEILNAGLPSAIATQEFIWIAQAIIPLKPDIVIIFDGFNDMIGHASTARATGHPFKFSELEKLFKERPSSTKAYLRKRLMTYRPTKKIIEALERKKEAGRVRSAKYAVNPDAVSYYKTMLDRMSHLLHSYGIKAIFVYQPSIFFKKDLGEGEGLIMGEFSEEDNGVFKKMLAMGRIAMEEAVADNGDIFIDASGIFDAYRDDIFFDQAHFGDEGQEITARFLYEKLRTVTGPAPAEEPQKASAY